MVSSNYRNALCNITLFYLGDRLVIEMRAENNRTMVMRFVNEFVVNRSQSDFVEEFRLNNFHQIFEDFRIIEQ